MRKDVEKVLNKPRSGMIEVTDLISEKIETSNGLSVNQSKVILLFAFTIPLILLLLASIFFHNVLLFRVISLFTIPFLMWLIAIYVDPRPNIFHKIIWAAGILTLTIGVIYWTPTEINGGITNFKYVLKSGSSSREYVTFFNNVNNFKPGDAFFHDTGWSAIIFKYYFPDLPDYIIDGNDVLGLSDVQAMEEQIPQSSPEEIHAQRLWVVLDVDNLTAKVNTTADDRTRQLIAKYKCPIISYFHYPQAWDFAVYLCDLHQQ